MAKQLKKMDSAKTAVQAKRFPDGKHPDCVCESRDGGRHAPHCPVINHNKVADAGGDEIQPS